MSDTKTDSLLDIVGKTLSPAKSNSTDNDKGLVAVCERGNVSLGEPLLMGHNIIPRMAKVVESAESEVLYMGYQIDRDSDGEKALIDALKNLSDKAGANNKKIKVKMLINYKEGFAEKFKANSPNFFRTENLREEFPNLDFEYAEHFHGMFGSFHTKMLIVDGEQALVSSNDLFNKGKYSDGITRQVDVSSHITGGDLVPNGLRKEFINCWNSSQCYIVDQGSKKEKSSFQESPPAADNNSESKKDSEDTTNPEAKSEMAPAIYISKKAQGDLTQRNGISPYALALITAINNAQREVHIVTSNLNEEKIIDALAAATKRGVKIEIVLARDFNDSKESLPLMGGTNKQGIQRLYDKIAELGGTPNNLDVRWATVANEGNEIVSEAHPENQVHARTIIVDNLVFIGSSVCDKQSVYHSKEGDVIIESETYKQKYLDNVFKPIFDNGKKLVEDPKNIIQIDGKKKGFVKFVDKFKTLVNGLRGDDDNINKNTPTIG